MEAAPGSHWLVELSPVSLHMEPRLGFRRLFPLRLEQLVQLFASGALQDSLTCLFTHPFTNLTYSRCSTNVW